MKIKKVYEAPAGGVFSFGTGALICASLETETKNYVLNEVGDIVETDISSSISWE